MIAKLTSAQQRDIEVSLYFCPDEFFHKPTNEEVQEYLDLSERGIGKQLGKFSTNPIILGKSRRGLTMQMWEDGVLEGTIPYFTLLGGFENKKRWWQFWKSKNELLPRTVVDFMKREMFKGKDAALIESVYSQIQGT